MQDEKPPLGDRVGDERGPVTCPQPEGTIYQVISAGLRYVCNHDIKPIDVELE